MTNRFFLALAVTLGLLACPKEAPTNVAGTDDEKMDKIAPQLEELRSKTDVKGDEWCKLKDKACGLSKDACDIAGKHADREDFQKQCAASQEDCAKFTEGCASAPK
jgi:hypothetical protein